MRSDGLGSRVTTVPLPIGFHSARERVHLSPHMRFAIRASTGNTRGPQSIEPLIDAVHQAGSRRSPLHLELSADGDHVGVFANVPNDLSGTFVNALQDVSSGYSIAPAEEPVEQDSAASREWCITLRLTPDACMLRTWREFEDRVEHTRADPLSGIISTLRTGRSGRFATCVRLSVRRTTQARYDMVRRTLRRLDRRFLCNRFSTWHRDICTSPFWIVRVLAWSLRLLSIRRDGPPGSDEEKADHHLFECSLLISVRGPPDAARLAHRKLQELAGAFGCFTSHRVRFRSSRLRRDMRIRRSDRFTLCAAEIATLWHPPTEATDSVARLQRTPYPELEPPVWLPSPHRDPDVTELGRVQYRRQRPLRGLFLLTRGATSGSGILRPSGSSNKPPSADASGSGSTTVAGTCSSAGRRAWGSRR